MSIRFSYETGNFLAINEEEVREWIVCVVKERGMSVGKINYVFCTDESLLEINHKYLGHDTYTDVITFDYVSGTIVSGDIYISTERVVDNASKFQVPRDRELNRVIIHGVLHLLGQGDKTDLEAAEMRWLEERALSTLDEMFHMKQDCNRL